MLMKLIKEHVWLPGFLSPPRLGFLPFCWCKGTAARAPFSSPWKNGKQNLKTVEKNQGTNSMSGSPCNMRHRRASEAIPLFF